MVIKVQKRNLVRIISYTLAAFLVLIGFIIAKCHESRQYHRSVNYTYSRCLEDLSAEANNIHTSLQKIIYAGTPAQLSLLSSELSQQSGTAKSALSQLPSGEGELTAINRFLSQVGDYSVYLSKKSISGEKITQEERQNLINLQGISGELASKINDIRATYENGDLWDNEVIPSLKNSTANVNFGSTMLELEDTLTDYPTLIYDGPFSDHILTENPKMLQNAAEVSREKAREIAAEALGVDVKNVNNDRDEEGKMPSYNFTAKDTTVSVTKKGGHIVYFRKYREINENKLDCETAVQLAKDYLAKTKNTNFVENYYLSDEGVCTINFAYKEGATICYTDLIKVGVALDTGEIVLLECRGYLMNHYQRTIPTPAYTPEQAREVLSDALTVKSVNQALIPTEGNSEKHCYEFMCEGMSGEQILVYVNSSTLQEENILILLPTEGGTVTK
ncbi:MAG: germination protein YpeB [bacterium]|nr:germination protein YpeB [bacterium]